MAQLFSLQQIVPSGKAQHCRYAVLLGAVLSATVIRVILSLSLLSFPITAIFPAVVFDLYFLQLVVDVESTFTSQALLGTHSMCRTLVWNVQAQRYTRKLGPMRHKRPRLMYLMTR